MLQLNLEDDVQANARSEHSNLLPWHQLQSWSFTAQCIAQLTKVQEISTPNPSAKPREASAAKLLIFSKHFFPFFILPIIQWECEGCQKKKKQTNNNKPPSWAGLHSACRAVWKWEQRAPRDLSGPDHHSSRQQTLCILPGL